MKIAVIGAGAWGTALACAVSKAGHSAHLWARDKGLVTDILENRHNKKYLGDVPLPKDIKASTDMALTLDQSDAVLLVVPAQHLRNIAKDMAPFAPSVPVALCSKGVERETGALMSDVAQAELPHMSVAVLSGPTFASEVARGMPAATTIACKDQGSANILVSAVGSATFRPYISEDVIGVEVAGAVKNVLAIACGIVMGRALGDNARAALITRGLAEMGRLIVASGGDPKTVTGLSGLGDLSLTCSSLQSRNMSLGYALGQGEALSHILENRYSVTEGVWSAQSVAMVARDLGVEMPIVEAVDAIVTHGANIDKTIQKLMSRPFRSE